MSDQQAAWVRTVVLGGEKNAQAWGPFEVCACQYGMCGYCRDRNGHAQCTTRQWPGGDPPGTPETYLTNRRGLVGGSLPSADGKHRQVTLWLADRTCVWRCPCPCRDDTGRLPAGARAPIQEALFDAEPGPRAPRRARRGPDRGDPRRARQPVLFEL